MRTPFRWILLLILMFSLAGLACATVMGGEETAEDSPSTTENESQQPAATAAAETNDSSDQTAEGESSEESAQPTAAPAEGEETNTDTTDAPAVMSLDRVSESLEDMTSYRMQLVYEFTGTAADGTTTNQILSGDIAFVSDPPANSIVLTMEGFIPGMTGAQEVSLIQTADLLYTIMPGIPCVSAPAGQTADIQSTFGELANPDTFIGSLEGAQLASSDETINDVESLHYTFDESSITDTSNQFRTLDGHLYIAKDGNYVTRLQMQGEGTIDGATGPADGTLHLQLDILDVNQPIEIVAPADCTDATTMEIPGLDDGNPGDGGNGAYPTLDDATEVTAFQDILTYKTNSTFDAAVQFYRDEMAAAGWQTTGTDIVVSGSAIMQYSHSDGRKITITVTADPSGGGQLIVITPTP